MNFGAPTALPLMTWINLRGHTDLSDEEIDALQPWIGRQEVGPVSALFRGLDERLAALRTEVPCPFCEIVAGRSETQVLSRDRVAETLLFTPLGPVVPGHLLVIPERHVVDFTDDPRVTEAVMGSAARYANEIGGDFNLITSKGEAATQSVPHLHVHLVPRHEGDGLPLPWTPQQALEDQEHKESAKSEEQHP